MLSAIEKSAEEIVERIKRDGVATVKVADGRMLYISVPLLRRMLASATSESEVVALHILDQGKIV